MPVFVDTSALIALLVADDRMHDAARDAFERLAERQQRLVTSSYVLVETYALVQRRIGIDAVSAVRESIAPLLDVVWVDAPLHDAALEAFVRADRRKLSLVDCVSFEIMSQRGIRDVFAYDKHFEEQGFEPV